MTTGGPALETRPARCANCGTEIARSLLSCPSCATLVHAADLKRLAAEANEASATGDSATALTRWREALDLLPPSSTQYEQVAARAAALSRVVVPGSSKAGAPADARPWWKRGGALIGVVVIFAITKFKLLLLGLTKASTFFSMLAFLGIYWGIWGWRFALGVVVCIYIHEMGHVAALARFGIKASAPMFIPGFGAFVRMRQPLTSSWEDARVGLAGPVWGLAAAVGSYGLFVATGATIFKAVAQSAGFLNLFNLIPVWQLDGGRGFRALARRERWMAVAAIGLVWMVTSQGILLLVGAGAVYQAFRTAPVEGDPPMLGLFAALVAALAWLSVVPVVPVPVAP